MIPKIQDLIQQLSAFPHRAVSSRAKEAIFKTLTNWIDDPKVSIERHRFRSPYHFIQVLYWLLGGFLLALLIAPLSPAISLMLAVVLSWAGFRYFDWRSTPLLALPPSVPCFNFLARKPIPDAHIKIVLMAHWDTAPISLPYRPEMIKGFRSSVLMGLGVMVLTVLLIAAQMWLGEQAFFYWFRIGLIAYFLLQLLLVSLDFWRFGYANGANDNATGCAAALAIAQDLWRDSESGVEIELCITGAEEVGMLGAWHYAQQLDTHLPTYVLNFDTIGCEQLHLITRTGTLSPITYDPEMLNLAESAAQAAGIPIHVGPYHTADVDTVWFARQGLPCLTLISRNEAGVPAYIHRPEDTLEKIHWKTVDQAIALGKTIAASLIRTHVKSP